MDEKSNKVYKKVLSLEKDIVKLTNELKEKNRELEIEGALDKVRARTMAMHKSQDLSEIVALLFEEMGTFGFASAGCELILIDEKSDHLQFWQAGPAQNMILECFNIPRSIHPLFQKQWKAWKDQIPRLTITLEGQEKKEFDQLIFSKTDFKHLPKEVKKFIVNSGNVDVFSHVTFKHGLLEVVDTSPLSEEMFAILHRFGKVFEQTYTRFLDLQKAEAQTREAQIEAALERIRSRSMAMFDSEELGDVASLLYKELIDLGISNFFNCGFIIVKEEEGEQYGWLTQPEGAFKEKLNLPYPGDTVLKNRLKAWKAKEPVFFQKVGGKILAKHLKYVADRSHSRHQVETFMPFMPDPTFFYCGNFSKGYLHIISGEELGEEAEAIIARFTTVFEQTYTRFLDLQKAESRSREAQIEASLERVRSRSLAMRGTEEFLEVAAVVYEELKKLEITSFESCGFNIYDEEKEIQEIYNFHIDLKMLTEFQIPMKGDQILDERYMAWKRKDNIFYQTVGGKALDVHLSYAHQGMELDASSWTEKFGFPDPAHYHFGNFAQGYLHIISSEELTDEHKSILGSFAKVFEQTYTRFLDLQKAESQARESQIEAALERIRSRSMAMFNSEELGDVASVLYKELIDLGISNFFNCGFLIVKEEEGEQYGWLTQPGGAFEEKLNLPYPGDAILKNRLKAWKAKEPVFFQKVGGKTLSRHLKYVANHSHSQHQVETIMPHMPDPTYFYCGNFSEGYLHIITGEELGEEAEAIIERLTKVFEQTYTRFLDLQKAEEQAREAQIEVALERVRSRMMAMHKTEELHEALATIFIQLQTLGFDALGISLIIYDHDLAAEHWMTGFSGGEFPESYKIPYNDHPYFTEMLNAWQNGVPFEVFIFEGDLKIEYGNWALENSDFKRMPQEFKKEMVTPDRMFISDAFNSYGMIEILSPEPLPEESIIVLKRFSKVFEQTYTRFLDLQKAEAQAREAQIEAALERVRAASMAMHKSEDLILVANVMNKEFEKLGFTNSLQASFVLIDEEKKVQYLWGAQTDSKLMEYVPLPLFGDDVLQERYDAWKRKEAVLTVALTGEKRTRHLEVTMPLESQKKGREAVPDPFHICCGFIKYGYLTIISSDALAENQKIILARMAKVFEQTYTRFLDLQKAESQAREAQVEAALERVRSTSMAMHDSEDLHKVIVSVYNQLVALDLKVHSTQIVESIHDESGLRFWNAANDQVYPKLNFMPYNRNIYFTRFKSAVENRESFYSLILSKRQKDSLFRHYFTDSSHEGVPKSRKDFIFSSPGLALSVVVGKHTALFVLNYERIPYSNDENGIIQRFAQVFEQAYTRFLDLQKAEAQTREAQIEAALERVRAASMAMHASKDLLKVINLVYNQLADLGLSMHAAQIWDTLDDKQTLHMWNAGKDQDYPKQVHIPTTINAFFTRFRSAYENGESFYTQLLSKRQKDDMFKHYFENSKNVGVPESRKEFVYLSPGLVVSAAVGKDAALTIMRFDAIPYSAAENEILKRFGKVFDQSYTRFLDLKKAEAQAREAQIDAALERVRSTSMAMHNSKDLHKVIVSVHNEFEGLGLKVNSTQIVVSFKHGKYFLLWNAANGQTYPKLIKLPYSRSIFFKRFKLAIENSESFYSIILTKKQKDTFLRHYFDNSSHQDVPKERRDLIFNAPGLAMSNAIRKDFCLNVLRYDGVAYDNDENEIIKRFAKVFGQSYTRFLDLQKAESQTREAQIEAALERVRASTMAMHKSQELSKIVSVMYKEMELLGLAKWGCNIMIFHEDSTQIEFWLAEETDTTHTGNYFAKGKEHSVYRKLWNHWKKQGPPLTLHHQDAYKREFDEYWLNKTDFKYLPDVVKKSVFDRNEVFLNYATMRYGMLNAISYVPVNNEMLETLARFAKVFEQSYTRFLDLQKAEAQAREAQIEAALERVRAKAMAMHSSEDLSYTVDTFFVELKLLNVQPRRCGVGIIDRDSRVVELSATATAANSATKIVTASLTLSGHPVLNKIYENWLSQKEYQPVLRGKEIQDYYQVMNPEVSYPDMEENETEYGYYFFFKEGGVFAWTKEELPERDIEIFRRFNSALSLTYRRYIDLLEAEAQAREAQIETALERIRSASMAMHKSEELKHVVKVSFNQLNTLGINAEICMIDIFKKGTEDLHLWGATTQQVYDQVFHVPYFNHIYFKSIVKAKSTPNSIFGFSFSKTQTQSWHNHLLKKTKVGEEINAQRKKVVLSAKSINGIEAIQKNHGIIIYNFSQHNYTQSEQDLLLRISQVFEQAYTRFLDLQKAEAQAREALIEAALERVRSKTMAMHKSEELREVVAVLYKQVGDLGISDWGCNIQVFNQEDKTIEIWLSEDENKVFDRSFLFRGEKYARIKEQWDAWRKKVNRYSISLKGRSKTSYDNYVLQHTDFQYFPEEMKDGIRSIKEIHFNFVLMKYGYLVGINQTSAFSDSEYDILGRFAKVFEQSYTRFLDLERAETQAKEARIEATLERVRSKAMSMHSSSDLLDTTAVLIHELNSLNIHPARLGIAEMIPERQAGKIFTTQVAGQQQNLKLMADITLEGNATFEEIFDHWKNKKEYFPILKGKVMTNYYRELNKYVEVKRPPKGSVQYGLFMFYEKMGIYAWSEEPYEEDALNVYRRYLSVLGLTYQRYKDLKDAEMRAKEALREASLDRVRAVIASMRTAEDLQKITPLIWQELKTLEVPFFRCGVFIINESTEHIQVFLTSSSGDSLAALNLPFGTSDFMDDTLSHWRDQMIFKQEWTREQFVEWTQSIVDQGYLQDSKTYQGGEKPPEHLALHFVPFTQGMLYVGSERALEKYQLDLVQSLAEAFAVAYARYEDFKKLESANTALENTLEDLKSTQTQLIQSEKMASLGELTAGIAHEIQNPLNFVNNFSEVSSELIDEMNEEIENGDLEEAKFIAKDIKQNLEKINHHGKRADAIVKGMLQHSRKSTAEKELTDINKLADEYLRLAYHGLRAKDKTFNAALETNFDESLGLVEIIPQDIGRVILNLITNAFYVCNEKKKTTKDLDYKPTVSVSTKRVDSPFRDRRSMSAEEIGAGGERSKRESIEISVKDNGNGIPKNVIDKIFQPFFTTKPTGEGTGLGLSMSYDIVTKGHGGELTVETKEGEGTEFTISLPS